MSDFLPVLPEFLAILLPAVMDASATAIAEERATANQRAAFCFGLVLKTIFGIIIVRPLAVKMAEDETVTINLK
jgi:hypothetical protein